EQDFNVRQTEALVQKIREGVQVPARPKPATPPEVRALEERFQEALGTRVKLRAGRKGGRVIIYYYSDEEFQTLYAQLTGQEL
ncbi:MAG: stage 0 sporulation protein J, partial [Anaerolineae bacterium]|nr:stage 0 sporulation protein J [Anaerolineae bacterium]